MGKWWAAVVAGGLVGCIAGCGGGTEAETGRRMRIVEEEDPEPAPAKTSTPKAVGPAAQPAAISQTPHVVAQTSTEPQRRALVIGKLKTLSSALESFRRGAEQYPDQCSGQLSWRVMVLPFVGQRPLYQKFHLNEPWNSPHNLPLLKEIPDAYKSPERQDEKTNFQLVTGPRTAYPGRTGLEHCPDGFANTILLAEVAEHLAKPWTQPEDYTFEPTTAQRDLFGLRRDCCFVVLGLPSGVRRLSATISDGDLLALLSPAGGEPLSVNTVAPAASPEADTALMVELERNPPQRFGPPAAAKGKEPTEAAKTPAGKPGTVVTTPTANPPAAAEDPRLPIPSDRAIATAAATAKELYQGDYEAAKRSFEKRALARKLLRLARDVSADTAGTYVLLGIVRDMAASAGDLETALAAVEQLNKTFHVDPLPMRLKVLEQTAPSLASLAEAGQLYTKALELESELAAAHDFDGAKRALTLAQTAARRAGNREAIAHVNARRERLDERKQAFDRVAGAMHTLVVSPQDPAANAAVGRYLCLVEQNWAKGLPLLARGNDAKLSEFAAADLRNPSVAEEQASLADRWWEWSEKQKSVDAKQTGSKQPDAKPADAKQSDAKQLDSAERRSARSRAAHWYRQALPSLPANLTSERVKQRIAEVEKTEPRPKQTGNTAKIGNEEPG